MVGVDLAVLGVGGAVGAADKQRAQVLGAGAGAAALAGALVVAGAHAGPGREAVGGAEHGGRVGTGLGQDGGRRGGVDARDGLQQAQQVGMRREPLGDQPVEVGEAAGEGVELVRQVRQHGPAGGAQLRGQRVAETTRGKREVSAYSPGLRELPFTRYWLLYSADNPTQGFRMSLQGRSVLQAVSSAASRAAQPSRAPSRDIGFRQLGKVIEGGEFADGIEVIEHGRAAA